MLAKGGRLIEFRILGPFEVSGDGARVEIGRSRPRALLAILLLNADQAVSVGELVQGIWGENPPPSAEHLVRVYVSQLRGVLGSERIETHGRSYVLVLRKDDRLDTTEFERLLAEARSARDEQRLDDAQEAYGRALTLMRGPVLIDTPLEGAAVLDTARLRELGLAAQEERIDTMLARGQHRELIPELERLVGTEPLRERFRAQLILALYRAGRQADALAAYRDARSYLNEQLGIEPTIELQQLERAILQHDPSLAAPPNSSSPSIVRRPRARRSLVTVLLALACLAGVAVVVDSTGGKHAPAPSTVVRPDSLVELDAHTGAILADTPLGTTPGLLASIAGRVWVSSNADRTLIEIDPLRGNRITKTIGLASAPYRLIASADALWIANGFDGTLTKVSVPDGAVLPPFRPEPGSTGRLALAYSNGSVWSAAQDGILASLDSKTVRPIALIGGIADPEAVALGAGGVWVGQATQTEIIRINARTDRRTASIPIGGFATAIATSRHSVWALAPSEDRLWRIDPRTNAVVAGIDVGANASDVLVTGKDIWVVSDSNGTLTRIDPATNSGAKLIQLHYPLGGSTAEGKRLWITLAG